MAGSGLGEYFNKFNEIWTNVKNLNLKLRGYIAETNEGLLDTSLDAG